VLGSIWASTEIIAGNFLHNLRIPFTGEIMTFFAVFFLVAASTKWRVKGIIWRAGLICALMKFFSPGSAVFGPMIGIMSEALVLELTVRILGMNPVGFIIGGMITLCLPLVQKIINYIIIYGWNLLVVFDKSAEFIIKRFGANGLKPVHILLIWFSVNAVFGIIAAVSGYMSGKKNTGKDFRMTMKQADDSLFAAAGKSNPQGILASIIINVLLTAGILFVIKYDVAVAGFLVIAFIAYSIYRYRNTMRIFRNHKFWIQIILFTSLSGIVFAYVSGYGIMKGIETAVEMIERVVLLTVGFAIISIELRKPESLNYLRKKLSRNLSIALNSAFSAVPEIISSSKGIFSLLRPAVFIEELTSMMDYWYEKFRLNIEKSKIVFITGKSGAGKSTLLKEFSEKFRTEKRNVGGIVSEAVFDGGERKGYDVFSLKTGGRIPLCRTENIGALKLGKYFFDETAFEKINRELEDRISEGVDVVILDEIGLLEMDRKGLYSSLEKLMQTNSIPIMVLSVRKDILDEVKSYFGLGEIIVYDLDILSKTQAAEHAASNKIFG